MEDNGAPAKGENVDLTDMIRAPLTKLEIEKLISEQHPSISFSKKSRSGGSVAWESFSVVCVDGKPQELVKCHQCSGLFVWKQGSTSRLTRHASSCRPAPGGGIQMTIDQFHRKIVPEAAKQALNHAITVGLAKDLKPLGMIKGKGFRHIAQCLINFGAKFGFQNVDAVLQHPSTLKRKLPAIVQKEKQKIASIIKLAPTYPKLSLTTDMWTDKYKQRHFLSLSAHFINPRFQLESYMLAVDEFPDKDKTANNIRIECSKMLEEYFPENYSAVMNNSIAVTDGGSNFLNIFPNRLPCMCHKLNLVMHWMFNDKRPRDDLLTPLPPKRQFVLTDDCPIMKKTISGVKGLVRYFKKSGLNLRLEDTLKQENDTRWNSTLTMLESYQKSSTNVKRILVEKNEVGKLLNIDDSAVKLLVEFLSPFKKCTESWSMDKRPTIHTVVWWVEKLRSHIAIQNDDSTELQNLKRQARVCVEEYLTVDDIYIAACLLDPRYKKLRFVNDESRRRALSYIRKRIDEVEVGATSLIPPEGEVEASHSSAKRSRDEFEDSSEEEEAEDKHELDKYLEMKTAKSDDFDVLDYWRNMGSLPRLQKVALEILAIPASQTTDERVFSSTGATLSPRRTELKGSTLSNLTFIHKNIIL